MEVKRTPLGRFDKGSVGAHTTHGLSRTRLHRIYFNLVNRCTNPKYSKFDRYGGRGIKCEWPTFESFYEDMHESYEKHVALYGTKETSIDRYPNNDGNYCKSNTRWATNKEQSRNRSDNRYLLFRGESKTIAQWGEDLGIKAASISTRLRKGWTVEKTLSKIGLKQFTFNGKTQPMTEWSRELKIPYGKLWDRVIKEKWPLERAFTKK